ncbi:MAG: SDR family oxidoreductase [Syntrophobacteraceae bacterium]
MRPPQPVRSMRDSIDGARYLCLFGIGVLLQDCYPQLVLSLGREPDFLCDNARAKWGNEFFGKKCISPSELEALRDDTVVVITIKNYEKIFSQLRGIGIKDIFVSCFDRCYNSIHAVRKLEEDLFASSGHEPVASPAQGKWTLITGASRGVGRQIALGMARLGSNIIAHSRSVSHVKELVATCAAFGAQVVPVAAELGNLAEVDAMLSDLERLVPRIDIIFNNAAIPCPSGFWSSSGQDYLACYTVNAVAPISICRRLLPAMIKRGYGRVINITSSVQKRPETMAYACSKAALDKFVHDLAPSLRDTGVMMSLADPGWLRTDMTGFDGPNAVESVIPGVLLGALLDGDINGRWFGIQDYAGLSIEAAIRKAKFVLALPVDIPTTHFETTAREAK